MGAIWVVEETWCDEGTVDGEWGGELRWMVVVGRRMIRVSGGRWTRGFEMSVPGEISHERSWGEGGQIFSNLVKNKFNSVASCRSPSIPTLFFKASDGSQTSLHLPHVFSSCFTVL